MMPQEASANWIESRNHMQTLWTLKTFGRFLTENVDFSGIFADLKVDDTQIYNRKMCYESSFTSAVSCQPFYRC